MTTLTGSEAWKCDFPPPPNPSVRPSIHPSSQQPLNNVPSCCHCRGGGGDPYSAFGVSWGRARPERGGGGGWRLSTGWLLPPRHSDNDTMVTSGRGRSPLRLKAPLPPPVLSCSPHWLWSYVQSSSCPVDKVLKGKNLVNYFHCLFQTLPALLHKRFPFLAAVGISVLFHF